MKKYLIKKIAFFCFTCTFLYGCENTEKISLDEYYIKEIGEYDKFQSEEIIVNVTQEEIEADKEYLLIQDATIRKVNNRPIQKGDFVYVVYTLLDENKQLISQFQNRETDFCVGDYEFDKKIEDYIIGFYEGDSINNFLVEGINYLNEEKRLYINLEIVNIEEFVYPELTTDYLQEKYDVNTVEEFESYVEEYTRNNKYEMEKNEFKEKLLKEVIEKTEFESGYDVKVKERYEDLLESYSAYGKIYDLTLEQVLEKFSLSKEQVLENAKFYEAEWEVAQYLICKENLKLSNAQMKEAQNEYAVENFYDTTEELISDNGLQYVTEEIYIELIKDYLYEKSKEGNQ